MFVSQLHNIGPSAINNTVLHVGWPVSNGEEFLLYILHIQTHGPLHCQTSSPINIMQISVSHPLLFPSLSTFACFFSACNLTMGWSFLKIFHNGPEIIFMGKKQTRDSPESV